MSWASIRRSSIAGLLFGLIFGVTLALAQTGTTSLRGTVLDKSGATIVGAKVLLGNETQGLHREVTTDSSGAYEFLSLPPGHYSLTIEMSGFRKFEHKNLELLVNVPATENATLEVGSTTETVEVSAQTVTLNTSDASIGNAFNENQVKELPLEGRNVPDLLSLQPGVAYTNNRPDVPVSDTRNGAVNGARSDQANVTVDGVSVNAEGGQAFTSVLPVTLDSVQEFRVTTTNYNADQGGSSGAQVAMVTKSGTNQFHGSAYEYNRNTYTSANDFFVKNGEISNCLANDSP
jgi:carboxypeptidase family protein